MKAELAKASTIPADWYVERTVLDRENEAVFGSTWQLVARLDQLEEPGAFVTTEVAGEPVLIARTREGDIRAMSNVCRHRAGPVATGSGTCRSFVCGYHGWVYGLSGDLLATREFDEVENFDRTDHSLPRFETATWGPLVFVRLAKNGPLLDEVFGGLQEMVELDDLASFRFTHRKDWFIDCNWKVYVDNYLEGYHIPIVHPALNEELDYEKYEVETHEWFSIQHSPIKPEAKRLRKEEDGDEAQYFWIYPNLMINVYPDNFSTNLILPLGPERTITIFEWFFRDPGSAKDVLDETVGFSDEIQIEDISICEAVQRGLRSRTYSTGRYSVKRENGVYHFHELLRASLGEAVS